MCNSIKKCENCELDHNGEYGSGRFCSIKCSKGFATKNNRKEISEKLSEKFKGFNTKKNKEVEKKICSSCNINECNTRRCKYCLECKKYVSYKVLFNKFNLTNNNLIECNKYVLDILYNDYFVLKFSKIQMIEKYNIMTNTIYNFFKLNDIKLRTLTDAVNNCIEQGRYTVSSGTTYKQGKHTTWENKIIHYRSSYELNYAIYLDNLHIQYDVESLRIKYFDTQLNKTRYAIPDFYLIESNTIVEIKSNYTLNKINMQDKVKAYNELGYSFKLILDKKEQDL